jgi:tetratricopeptide (TPR) repeat protein
MAAILAALLLPGIPAMADPTGTFLAAETAYDAGNYTAAVKLYEEMLQQGVANPELHYNLANAAFKAGDLPTAVRHYRKAWYSNPRDPDIEANLQFALDAAGAVAPHPGRIDRILVSLSEGEWIAVATGLYLLAAVLAMTALFLPARRRGMLEGAAVALLLVLLCAAGWWQWHRLHLHPEWVVDHAGTTALFGPVEGTTAHYKIPLGALVCQRAVDPKGWIEVEYDGRTGWIKTERATRVSP